MQVDERYILEHFDEAVEKGHIQAYFQPIYRTLTDQICAAEALARWVDPELGMLSPADFIGVLEEHRLICRLDLAVLRRTCAFYARLRETDAPVHSFSVNFSRLDFDEADLFERVTAILDEYNVPPEAIKLEITESVMLDDWARFRQVLDRFQSVGFTIWVDDFGSGYSSLNVLQEYNFDLLKIDMMFLRSFNARSRQLIATIVNMAKTLGFYTLAEGLETEEQLRFLKMIGCELVQGFLYSKPLDEAAFAAMLTSGKVELWSDKSYWDAAGRFNLLSANPLEAFGAKAGEESAEDLSLYHSDIPLALLQCTWKSVNYIYASEEYLKRIRALGFSDIDNVEHAFNEKTNPRYGQLKKLILDAITRDRVQEMDYMTRDVYYKFKVRCIAKTRSKAVVAAYLRTFDSDQDVEQRDELMKYSKALYATYQHVNVLYPKKDASERIFSRANFQTAHQLGSLRSGIRSFAEKEVHPEDRARYLRFFDLDTLEQRMTASGKDFVQQPFRISDDAQDYAWKAVRITRIPSVMEEMYLYTIQEMSEANIQVVDAMAAENPGLLEQET